MSIREYRLGRFQVRIYHAGQRIELGRTIDGEWPLATHEMAEKTERDVQALIKASRGKLDLSKFKKKHSTRFERAVETWKKLATCSLDWQEGRNRIVENFLLPYFRGTNLEDLQDTHLIEFHAKLKEGKISDKYIYNILGVLKSIFNLFKIEREFPRITFQDAIPRSLTRGQQDQVFEFIRPQDLPIFTFCRWTGCRPSEASGLLRQNIFLNANPPYVVLATVRGVKGNIKPNTKNKKVKPLYIISEIEWTLHPKEVTPFVFTRNGRTYSKWMLEKAWDKANKKATEKYATPRINLYNGLKHSFVSQRLSAGYPIDAIMNITGNIDQRTMRRYGAYDIARQREVMQGK